MHQNPIKKITSIVIIIFTIFAGCSSSKGTYTSLNNQGLLPLSPNNAYVGSNLFLSDEFQKSTHLFNFLKSRGAPNAIELKEKSFGKQNLYLHYPKDKEYYIAELLKTETDYQWITRGPYRIDRTQYKQLAGLFDEGVSEPQFVLSGKPFRFKPSAEEILAMQPKPTIIPVPRISTKPKLPANADSGKLTTKLAETTPTAVPTVAGPFKPLTYDQQALAMSQGFAERAENGDVIHTVKSASETPEQIAQWYTGNPANAQAILTQNGIATDGALTTGARIQIPVSLVKQFKRM